MYIHIRKIALYIESGELLAFKNSESEDRR